jgi:hypothetical protein
MQKKLFIGLFLAAIAGVVAGEYLFNRSGAQDAPNKAKMEEKKSDGDLFDILKKELDAQRKTGKDEKLPTFPVPPPAAPQGNAKDSIPPPSVSKPDHEVPNPAPSPLPSVGTTSQAVPPPIVSQPPLPSVPVKPATLEPERTNLPPPAKPEPRASELKDVTVPLPAKAPDKPPIVEPEPIPQQVEFPLPNEAPRPSQTGPKGPPNLQLSPMQPIVDEVAKLKNCPWTLQVDMVDGQTVVTATVNKKHEFRIHCQSLDLQTGKGTLKASGKVRISSAALSGACDHLEIPLLEDRLVLEGGAEVRIPNDAANISNVTPAAFELKSQTLNLRVSELPSGKIAHAGWNVPPASLPSSIVVDGNYPATNMPESPASSFSIGEAPFRGPWTGYGILRRTKDVYNGRPVWCLEGRDGRRFGRFVAREGGTLDAFEGQTLSVYLQSDKVMSYATHIALP